MIRALQLQRLRDALLSAVRDLSRSEKTKIALSAVCGLVLFWFSLKTVNNDWHIGSVHADVLFSAFWSFHEFPFFSYAFDGGAYFLQDPQNSLLSPASLPIIAFGPSIGLRVGIMVWGAVGCYGFTRWLERYVDWRAALLGGMSWALSLCFLRHIEAGNEMFLWHLALPLFLLTLERLVQGLQVGTAVTLGLLAGAYVLGPTFHSLFYFVLPALAAWTLLLLREERPLGATARLLLLVALASTIAVFVAAPRLFAWSAGALRRPVDSDSGLDLWSAIALLPEYITARAATLYRPHGTIYWVHESAMALAPPATLLAALGLVTRKSAATRRVGSLAAWLVVLGLFLSCSGEAWAHIHDLTGGNFRVPDRFLPLAGAGVAIFASLGAGWVLTRLGRFSDTAFWGLAATVVISALIWVHNAERAVVPRDAPNIGVKVDAMSPLATWLGEVRAVRSLKSFTRTTPMIGNTPEHELLKGEAVHPAFFVVGNVERPRIKPTAALVTGSVSGWTVSHTRIDLYGLEPNGSAVVMVMEPMHGQRVKTSSGSVVVTPLAAGLQVRNTGSQRINHVTLRPTLPVPVASFVISALTLAGGLGFLARSRRARRLVAAAPNAPTAHQEP